LDKSDLENIHSSFVISVSVDLVDLMVYDVLHDWFLVIAIIQRYNYCKRDLIDIGDLVL